jgi:hypothetical protein
MHGLPKYQRLGGGHAAGHVVRALVLGHALHLALPAWAQRLRTCNGGVRSATAGAAVASQRTRQRDQRWRGGTQCTHIALISLRVCAAQGCQTSRNPVPDVLQHVKVRVRHLLPLPATRQPQTLGLRRAGSSLPRLSPLGRRQRRRARRHRASQSSPSPPRQSTARSATGTHMEVRMHRPTAHSSSVHMSEACEGGR